MKKRLGILLTCLLVLTGCGKEIREEPVDTQTPAASQTTQAPPESLPQSTEPAGPVLLEQLTGIACATLRDQKTQIPLTDPAALAQLEEMLTGGQYILGGTGCPFTALLDLELETGEQVTIALATDSCGIWMSEGSYYEFANDSKALYDLFDVTLEFGEIRK